MDAEGVEKQLRKVRVISYQLVDRYFNRSQTPEFMSGDEIV